MRPCTICFALVFFLISLAGCSQPSFDEKAWLDSVESTEIEMLYADHYRDGRFFNPWLNLEKGFMELITWKLSGTQPYTDKQKTFLPAVRSDAKQQILESGGADFILWIGHNSFLIKTGEQVWLLDPMFSKRALLPARKTPPALTAQEINQLFPAVTVIISHNHYDHLDKNSIEQLSDRYHYIVPLGVKKTIRSWQPEASVIEMDWWQTQELPGGYEIHCLPAQHWSRRVFEGENRSLWASYMILTPQTTIYFAGDSGYFIGYREIGRRYPGIDYALIPTTAYHPRWFMHKAHMNIEEAIRAFGELNARMFIPTQWGTFHLGDEPPGYPGLDLKETIESRQLNKERYLILDIGEPHRFTQ